MEILVIGNGFDIEHGLPTQYKDFLDFMKAIDVISNEGYINSKKAFISKLDEIVGHKIDEKVRGFVSQDKFFERESLNEWKKDNNTMELVDCCKNNIWLQYFLKNQQYIDKRWVDFEAEISKVIQCLEYSKTLSEFYKKESRIHLNPLSGYSDYDEEKVEVVNEIITNKRINIAGAHLVSGSDLKKVIKELDNDLIQLTRCLEIYLCDYVEKLPIESKSKYISDDKYDGILSFNYTNTFEKIYKPKEGILEKHYDYIHGKADLSKHTNKDENNMVLGIDEYLDEKEKNNKLEFITFKKYFQRIYKKTGNEYTKWITNMNEYYETKIDGDIFGQQIDNHIYIFGHSLDISDKDILKSLILESGFKNDKDGTYDANTKVIIYHHDKDAYAQQIANLVRIIGQDELIARVSGENPTIIFKQQD